MNAVTRFTQNVLSSVCSFLYLFLLLALTILSHSGRRRVAELTCVWCRAKCSKNESDASTTSAGYVNLGKVAGLSGKRDTSSCKRLATSCYLREVDQRHFYQIITVGSGVPEL